jgi:hypothetical protein
MRIRTPGGLRAAIAVLPTTAAPPTSAPTTVPTTTPPTTAPPTTTTTAPATALPGGSVLVPAPSGPSVAPPAAIAADCSTDVSVPLQRWLKSLAPGQTVVVPAGACYLVSEGVKLKNAQGLTLYGGTYRSAARPAGQNPRDKGRPVFTLLGGSGVTLEAMKITGANPGGYHPRLAFAGGIEIEGTARATVRGVTVSGTYGDGVTVAPLRGGANHNSGTIVAVPSQLVMADLTVSGVGRQGIAFASVAGATVTDVVIENPGLDTFDFEADQWNEGATDVTIDGCRAAGGALFLANGGAGNARHTRDITVDHCTMAKPEGGSAVLVVRPPSSRGAALRGPFTLSDDDLWCGASVYVACVQLSGGQVDISASVLRFPPGTVHEPVVHLVSGAQATFTDVAVHGFGRVGYVSPTSSLHVSGGQWIRSGSR